MRVSWWSLEKFKMPVKIFAVEWKESATNPLAFNSFNSPSEKHSRYFQYKFTLNNNIIYLREFVVYPVLGPALVRQRYNAHFNEWQKIRRRRLLSTQSDAMQTHTQRTKHSREDAHKCWKDFVISLLKCDGGLRGNGICVF